MVVEPMANVLLNEVAKDRVGLSHMDFYNPEVVYRLFAQPAEQRVCFIEGRADFVYTINAIDHAYDPIKCVRNMARMLKSCSLQSVHGGSAARMLVSVDLEHIPHPGHPHTLTRAALEAEYARSNLHVMWYRNRTQVYDVQYPGIHGTWMLKRRC